VNYSSDNNTRPSSSGNRVVATARWWSFRRRYTRRIQSYMS